MVWELTCGKVSSFVWRHTVAKENESQDSEHGPRSGTSPAFHQQLAQFLKETVEQQTNTRAQTNQRDGRPCPRLAR